MSEDEMSLYDGDWRGVVTHQTFGIFSNNHEIYVGLVQWVGCDLVSAFQ